MKQGFRSLVLVAVVGLFSTGCALNNFQTARTNGAGNFQFGIEPGIAGFSVPNSDIGGFAPQFNLAGRYGITDSVDIGARIGTIGYEIQTKFGFTDGSDPTALQLALAPGITAIAFGSGGASVFAITSRIPFLIGIPVGSNGSELTIGPRLGPSFYGGGGGGSSAGGFVLTGGGTIGFAAKVGSSFTVIPEIGITVPIVAGATVNGDSAAAAGAEGFFYGGGVGLVFGGRKFNKAAAPSAAPAQ